MEEGICLARCDAGTLDEGVLEGAGPDVRAPDVVLKVGEPLEGADTMGVVLPVVDSFPSFADDFSFAVPLPRSRLKRPLRSLSSGPSVDIWLTPFLHCQLITSLDVGSIWTGETVGVNRHVSVNAALEAITLEDKSYTTT